MNYKTFLATSPFGLGLCMLLLSFPFTLIMKWIGLEQPGFGLVFAGYTAAYIFTYYGHCTRMNAAFKLKAIGITVALSLIVTGIFLACQPDLRDLLALLVTSMLQTTDFHTLCLVVLGTILQLAIPGIAWYFFISMGNTQALQSRAAQEST